MILETKITDTINNKIKDQHNNKPNLLLALTGSVATIKLSELYTILHQDYNIKIIATQNARKFIDKSHKNNNDRININDILYDQMQWNLWEQRNDPVLHIQLRKWADCMLIAPLSANTLAKITHGIADNLVTLVCRAWDMKINKIKENKVISKININKEQKQRQQQYMNKLIKPIFICPAMNTYMWQHPITKQQLDILVLKWGYTQIGPICKKLMCGQYGNGAMANLQEIKDILEKWKKQEYHNVKQ